MGNVNWSHVFNESIGAPTYGNYGGPNWTGVQVNGRQTNVTPIGPIDEAFRQHDIAFYSGSSRVRKVANEKLYKSITEIKSDNPTYWKNLDLLDRVYLNNVVTVFIPQDINHSLKITGHEAIIWAEEIAKGERVECFPAGTPITLASGETVSIEDIAIADQIAAAHQDGALKSDFVLDADGASKPDNMLGIVAEKGGRIIGATWASAIQYALCEELILAGCHVIAVDPKGLGPITPVKTFLRLISGIKKWSDSIGAQEILAHVTTGTNLKTTDRLLRRSGAKCIGGGYVV